MDYFNENIFDSSGKQVNLEKVSSLVLENTERVAKLGNWPPYIGLDS